MFTENKFLTKKIISISFFVLVFLLGVGIFFWRTRKVKESSQVSNVVAQVPTDIAKDITKEISSTPLANEKASPVADNDMTIFSSSEKYHIKEISIGGNSEVLSDETETTPLSISDVRSKMLSSRDGSQSNLLITWKTSKMTASDVSYDYGGITKKLSESGFGYSHTVVLSDLEQSQRYTFVIEATDRWGNKQRSENFSVYTGKKNTSVVELITGQFKDIFSWAVKK